MRIRKNINDIGWKFRKNCSSIPSAYPVDWEDVTLPHTWNALDGQDGGNDYFRGACVYAAQLERPDTDGCIFLEVEAASLIADVYVNEKKVGHHEGGYSAFRLDITESLTEDKNLLCICVDNSDCGHVYPQMADFTFFGGLYRNVSLIMVPKSHFDLNYYGGEGIICKTKVCDGSAELTAKAWIEDARDGDLVQFVIKNAEGHVVAGDAVKAAREVSVILEISAPHLWQGTEDPYLYSIAAELIRDEKVLDQVMIPLGIRTFAVDPKKGFILNGKVTPLRGVSRHQDREGKGYALSEADMLEDAQLIHELGANTVRLAHYQHSRHFYDLCDRFGFVVWAEIPLISAMNEEEQAHENCRSQLTELICQNYHHPSICFWGISNEITIGGETPKMEERLRELNQLAKKLDPDRLTTMAQFFMHPIDSRLNSVTDVLSYNHYFGWYVGEFKDNEAWIDNFHEKYPDRPLGISEYGCEAITAYHSDNPKRRDYTEEYQALYHEHMAEAISKRPWLWATHVWNMFDFAADGRDEGGVKGRNNKGLVTMDRRIKKDSFFIYKAYWSKEPFVHICGRRYAQRTGDTISVKVYSNQPEVTLYMDGKRIAGKKGDKVFCFEGIPFSEGEHTVAAKAGACEDQITLEKTETVNPSYLCPGASEDGSVPNWFEGNMEEMFGKILKNVSPEMLEILKRELQK